VRTGKRWRRGIIGREALLVLIVAVVAVVESRRPARAVAVAAGEPEAPIPAFVRPPVLSVGASLNAFGNSREVKLRFALPGDDVEFPLEVSGDPSELTYEWIALRDTAVQTPPKAIVGSAFTAPDRPGFYHLAIHHGVDRHIVNEPTLVVMVPFTQKLGSSLNGYRIGTYLAERLIGDHDRPNGFVEVRPGDLDLMVSRHLRLGDFLTHDGQKAVWPKYVALNPRLLDKLELVLAKIGSSARFARDTAEVAFDVHSGFRTPAYNRGVRFAARDSRHQYGDAADVAIDADGDGRVTLKDEALVARAVDQVEIEHPELVGGLGLYTSRRYRIPYVHIDARGKRSRWKG
jgi:uncharacterized protein YcbK (DUF882 family)